MKLCFVDIEPPERVFFEKEFPDEELNFCRDLEEAPEDTEVLSVFIESKINARFLDRHPALKFIATRSTTFDHIDLAECERRSITVGTVGSYGDHTVAEHIFGLLLVVTRRLREAMQVDPSRPFSYQVLRSTELNGKTFGAIGAGRIGRQTLRLAKAFGMDTLAADPLPDPEAAAQIGFTYVTLDELLRRSHFISLNLPLTPDSHHLLNRETLARCRPGVIIINTARGAIIDTEALIEALDAGIVGGAGLDVLEDERVMRKSASHILTGEIMKRLQHGFGDLEPLPQDPDRVNAVRKLMHNSDLLAHPHVVFTPHIAFNSAEALDRINRTTAESIHAFIAGETPQNLVPSLETKSCVVSDKKR